MPDQGELKRSGIDFGNVFMQAMYRRAAGLPDQPYVPLPRPDGKGQEDEVKIAPPKEQPFLPSDD